MNIKQIKSEIEKLSLMLSSWEGAEQVSTIERDIVLDKLKAIYNAVRFDEVIEPSAPVVIPPVAPEPVAETKDEEAESDEKEVEVEIIFAEDEFSEEELLDEEPADENPVSDFIAATVASALTDVTANEEIAEEPVPAVIAEPEPIVAPEPIAPVIEEVVAVEPQPVVVAEPEPIVAAEPVIETPIEKPAEKPAEEPKRPMDSLFNMDEVRRQPRSKHQRMMSIYNNSQPRQEKVVDISKIFNMDIDEPEESKPAEVVAKPQPKEVVAKSAPVPAVEEKPATLADAIPAPQTLADTLAAPTPLADEINHSRLRSLRNGIGLNDKFLMIRDLFDGDGDAYEEAINALDELETLDDCMIHIIENYAWNPDSEGSKFIMQLLERKLS
jgi:hypothetical protein